MPDVVIYQKAFLELFNDFAWYTFAASKTASAERPQGDRRFVKTSILYGSLCIESASNCCLNAVGLTKECEKDLEHSKTLSKFDIFLLSAGRPDSLDRDHIVVKKIIDLIQVRNGYVHPKVRQSQYQYSGNRLEKANYLKHKFLDIAVEHDAWIALDCHKVYVAVHDFLMYVFFDALGLDILNIDQRGTAAQILSSEIEHFTIKESYITPGRKRLLMNPAEGICELAQKHELDNAFLGWYGHDGKGNMILPKRKIGDPIK